MGEKYARNIAYLIVNPSEDFLVVAPAVKKNNLVCT
jgi:hypothetical protein